jgi:hypothetical protein
MAHFRLLDRPIEKWSFIKRDDRNNKKLAIFVHGFRGDHLATWLDLPNFLFRHAGSDRQLQNWDYLFLGYETYSIGNYVAIARLISSQWERASKGLPPYGPTAYEKLALIGHSLGTLGIRQLLCASSLHPKVTCH